MNNRNSQKSLDDLIRLMARLPGLGPRSARRAVLHLIKRRESLMQPLVQTMAQAAQDVRECLSCGNLDLGETCDICRDPRRATARQLCIVEGVSDLWAMERAGMFRGRYHVLGGTLSALDAVGPDDLRIPALLQRIHDEEITEVILALNATLEGQTTAHYIADHLKGITVTSLAQGVPMGGELDYLDDGTITTALQARKAF